MIYFYLSLTSFLLSPTGVHDFVSNNRSIDFLDSLRRIIGFSKGDEAETFGGSVLVASQLERNDVSKGSKQISKIIFAKSVRQVFDEHVVELVL